MRIFFIRHGETDWNKQRKIQGRSDISLNDIGIKQIENTALFLKNKNIIISKIYSSPLNRALSSSIIVKNILNINNDIIVKNCLMERYFGKYEGLDISDLPYFKENIEDYETNNTLIKRTLNCFYDIIANHDNDDNIIIISHSHCIKGILIGLKIENIKFDYKIKNGEIKELIYNKNKRTAILI